MLDDREEVRTELALQPFHDLVTPKIVVVGIGDPVVHHLPVNWVRYDACDEGDAIAPQFATLRVECTVGAINR